MQNTDYLSKRFSSKENQNISAILRSSADGNATAANQLITNNYLSQIATASNADIEQAWYLDDVGNNVWVEVIWDETVSPPTKTISYFDSPGGSIVTPVLPLHPLATDNRAATPELHLEENVGNSTVSSPFLADYVRVSYQCPTIGSHTPAIITIHGLGNAGNSQLKVYPNTVESLPKFITPTILSITSTGVSTDCSLDVEFRVG